MIPKECKRLAEVDFPIAVVSKHSAREKSIRHGHPSTLHLWWARRPLAACRAMLLGLLLPDPCDSHCPADFKQKARELLLKTRGKIDADDMDLRQALLAFIGDFADWDNSSHPTYLEVGRGLVKAAHPEETPLVVDPFAGGGSIPLEALRLGCDAFASDLNPVACLILKVMLEDIPRHGPKLADELRRVGAQIKGAAETELADFYPADPDGARPIAYLWARTVRCESPNCGAEIPLVRSFWLCKKPNRKWALRYEVIRPKNGTPHVRFEIFEPKRDTEVPEGTVSRAKATCRCCETVLGPDRVRAQLREQRGGADVTFDTTGKRVAGARLLAVVTLKPGEAGRHYRLPTERDFAGVRKAIHRLAEVSKEKLPSGLGPVPDEPTPAGGGSGAGRAFSIQKYGMMQWGDMFTARQKIALSTLGGHAAALPSSNLSEPFALVISRLSDYGSASCSWPPTGEFIRGTFGRNALPIIWDFAEAVPWTDSSGNVEGAIDWVSRVIEAIPPLEKTGQVQQADSCVSPLPNESASAWFTDPPYYDAIPYSDLSDFFLVWMKRTLPIHPFFRDPFDPTNPLSPKLREAVQDETRSVNGRPKDRAFFEETMAKAFAEGRRVLREDGMGSVVFAHKTTEGWEALLNGMIRGGWTITGSWPIATERPGRLRSQDSAALATSVHLVCRPRPAKADIGDWANVLRELPKRVSDWMERLQGEGLRGADLVFACIGPALEIYSRYAKVVDAEEREIPLGGDPETTDPHKRGYLAYVWEVVGRTALQQVLGTPEAKARNGGAGALEEDARLTALFLWTLQTTAVEVTPDGGDEEQEEPDDDDDEPAAGGKQKGFTLPFDVVRRFAQPLGIRLPDWERRIIDVTKGIVRLLPVSERQVQLFGEERLATIGDRLERAPRGQAQMTLFADQEAAPIVKTRGRGKKAVKTSQSEIVTRTEATTLDRVHAAMLLQAGGQTNALRRLLRDEQDRGPDFLRLANSLSALYPKDSDEKRLLDAMLLAVPR
jgi:adenine-specific DNA methylase